ncbi:MAG: N-acetylmuramoyl-L-alanine amidase [Allorhizobium sp.]
MAWVVLAAAVTPAVAVEAPEASADAPYLAYAARIAGDRARTRIVIDFDRKPEFQIHYISRPDRIVIDLPATVFGFAADDLDARGLFKDIRYGSMDAESARMVLTSVRPAKLVMSEVQANTDGKGYRLVLDAEMVSEEAFAALAKDTPWAAPVSVSATRGDRIAAEAPHDDHKFIIAVDAGHGGIDAGATASETKTPEKDITLGFARALTDRLSKEPGIEAFLVRDKDEFLSLSERVVIARQGHADLLISFHADTLRQASIRGATVYTISDKASDNMAAELAERENFSDEVAGVGLTGEPAKVSDILLDLTRRETLAFSVSMANSVVSSFDGQVTLINNPHRYAGFRVLQAPDIPSILLELGFLSNKEDEKLLLDEKWRGHIADLLTQAIIRYRNPIVADGG